MAEAPGSKTSSSITSRLINNILEWCSELQQTARDYSQLGSNEQAKVWNDMTGDEGRRRTFDAQGREYFSKELYEPNELVEQAMKDLVSELDKIPSKKKVALEKAMETSPQYVENFGFRMKFLRAEKFDAHLAAVRMALHFEDKLALFGEEKLGREILLSDLNEDDIACLKTGYMQILKELDFSNRHVLFYYKAVSGCYKERENLLRSFWYIANVLSYNEDVQKLGVVNVVYNLCGFPKEGIDYEKSRRVAGLFKSVPLRFCSFYPCVNTRAWKITIETFSVIISKYLRIRFRVINGDHEEVLLKLKSIGIPSESMPVTEDGDLLVDDFSDWLEDQTDKEEALPEPVGKRRRAELGDIASLCEHRTVSNLLESASSFYAVG